MRLWAISDLHLGASRNRDALRELPAFPEDWLILAGDVCEDEALFEQAAAFLAARFARVIWTPGNHELWLTRRASGAARSSLDKYAALVAAARRHGVATPEDEYLVWPGTGVVIAPVLTLYDYSFRPEDVPRAEVRRWAEETRCVPADEHLIDAAPLPGIEAWCAERCEGTAARLAREVPPGRGCVIAGHFPLRRDLVRIPRIPRFAPWCGTRRTEDWHRDFNAVAVVSGHLHVRRVDWRDGTRFEEVSLGYPSQWDPAAGIAAYLREVPTARPFPSAGAVAGPGAGGSVVSGPGARGSVRSTAKLKGCSVHAVRTGL